jgi:hypothetical protein
MAHVFRTDLQLTRYWRSFAKFNKCLLAGSFFNCAWYKRPDLADIAVAALLSPQIGVMSHCPIVVHLNENEHANRTVAVCCTLFFPGKKRILKWKVMTNNQYNTAEMELGARLQSMREAGQHLLFPRH